MAPSLFPQPFDTPHCISARLGLLSLTWKMLSRMLRTVSLLATIVDPILYPSSFPSCMCTQLVPFAMIDPDTCVCLRLHRRHQISAWRETNPDQHT